MPGFNDDIPMYSTTPKYLDPMTDYGFKKLFGQESSKVYLIDFLNSVFGDCLPKIESLEFRKTEHLGSTSIDRNVVFDLYARSPSGERFIIELQKAKQTHFRDRSLYYATFALQEQAVKGERWDFKLDPVYVVGILDFAMDDHPNCIKSGVIMDKFTLKPLVEKLSMTFLECKKIKIDLSEIKSKKDQWLYVIKNLADLGDQPHPLRDQLFNNFFTEASLEYLNIEEKALYQESLKYTRDLYNIEVQNLEKGIAQGRAEGEIQKAREIARKMRAMGLDDAMIAQVSGLSLEEIQNL